MLSFHMDPAVMLIRLNVGNVSLILKFNLILKMWGWRA